MLCRLRQARVLPVPPAHCPAGNSRGNGFSRNHTGLEPGRAKFWDFSWDEMAAFDVPAMVSYVLQQSEPTKSQARQKPGRL